MNDDPVGETTRIAASLSGGRGELSYFAQRCAGQPPAGLDRVCEARCEFGFADPEKREQRLLVGALRDAGRAQHDPVGDPFDAQAAAPDGLGLERLDRRLVVADLIGECGT